MPARRTPHSDAHRAQARASILAYRASLTPTERREQARRRGIANCRYKNQRVYSSKILEILQAAQGAGVTIDKICVSLGLTTMQALHGIGALRKLGHRIDRVARKTYALVALAQD